MNSVQTISQNIAVHHVLISLFDKTNLDTLVLGLLANCPGVRLYSTGGTYQAIKMMLGDRAGAHLIQVSDFTGQPEMQGGLVKTLDYKIYLGLLSEPGNRDHADDVQRVGGLLFDCTVVNLYPFGQITADRQSTLETARSYIDIGGPAMLRASAKNFLRVVTVADPADYQPLAAELEQLRGQVSLATRLRLAQKAFAKTSEYDATIAGYLSRHQADTGCYEIV